MTSELKKDFLTRMVTLLQDVDVLTAVQARSLRTSVRGSE